jgi:hypothetical protein
LSLFHIPLVPINRCSPCEVGVCIPTGSWQSPILIGIATDYGLDGPGSILGKSNRHFVFSTASSQARGPTQPPIQWVEGAIFPRVKLQKREADHSPPPSVEVKKSGTIPPHPPMSSWHGA